MSTSQMGTLNLQSGTQAVRELQYLAVSHPALDASIQAIIEEITLSIPEIQVGTPPPLKSIHRGDPKGDITLLQTLYPPLATRLTQLLNQISEDTAGEQSLQLLTPLTEGQNILLGQLRRQFYQEGQAIDRWPAIQSTLTSELLNSALKLKEPSFFLFESKEGSRLYITDGKNAPYAENFDCIPSPFSPENYSQLRKSIHEDGLHLLPNGHVAGTLRAKWKFPEQDWGLYELGENPDFLKIFSAARDQVRDPLARTTCLVYRCISASATINPLT